MVRECQKGTNFSRSVSFSPPCIATYLGVLTLLAVPLPHAVMQEEEVELRVTERVGRDSYPAPASPLELSLGEPEMMVVERAVLHVPMTNWAFHLSS